MRISYKHQFARLSLTLTAIALALFACAPAVATPTSKGGGGTLQVALRTEPKSLNPDLQTDDAAFILAQSIYNKLVTLDGDYQIIPDLARTWEISPDGLTYTFHLATDVRWHDGEPFTSSDVKWTLEQIINANGIMKNDLDIIQSMEAPDEHTIILYLREPAAPLLSTLSWYGTFILPRHVYENTDWTTNPANAQPVGTGPFQFREWVAGERIVLKANTEYFRDGPYLDQIIYRTYPDADAVMEALLQGEIHYTLMPLPNDALATLATTPEIRVETFPHPARHYLALNLRREPLDDVRVRQALNAAINRTEIVNQALAGYGSPGVGFYTPALPWAYNGAAQVPAHDPATAEALLEDAGLPRDSEGARLRLNLVHVSFAPWPDIAQVVQAQLDQVGIKVTLESEDGQTWSTRVIDTHDFDLALMNGSQGPDPNNMRVRFGSEGQMQVMGYSNAELDALLEQGARIADIEARAEAYHAAQAILAQDLPIAPLAEFVNVEIFRANVTGLPRIEGQGLVTFHDFSLVQLLEED